MKGRKIYANGVLQTAPTVVTTAFLLRSPKSIFVSAAMRSSSLRHAQTSSRLLKMKPASPIQMTTRWLFPKRSKLATQHLLVKKGSKINVGVTNYIWYSLFQHFCYDKRKTPKRHRLPNKRTWRYIKDV